MRTRLLTGALLAAVLVPTTALAGNLQIRDPGDVLPAQEEVSLREAARAWPFDARVVVTTEMSSRADFDRYVGAQVASANMVVVGVDPTHRLTSVHFGTGTRIARARFSAIENAGDGWFRQGQWRSGIEAILTSANSAVGSGSPGAVAGSPAGASESRSNESAPSFPWGLVLLGLGGVAIAVMVFRAARNRAQVGPMGPGADPYRAQQYPPGYNPNGPGGYGPGYGGPGYGPQQGGMGGLGAGILGAGVGGLAGYALGSHMANRDESHGADHVAGSDNNGGGFDAGGSSSGWDDGGGGGGDFGGGDGGGGGDW
ncbi:MAG: hypothetical protein Q8S73_11640 [Deltaproteobacteria bacterium]|nr:hypothetical protein [Myxococcales bacterium]MDP3214750.1 hypothetical protein [Deltaproteobacteria bacterium]